MHVYIYIQHDLCLEMVFLARKMVFWLPSSSERPALVDALVEASRLEAPLAILRLLAGALALALLLTNSRILAVFVRGQVRKILDLLCILT